MHRCQALLVLFVLAVTQAGCIPTIGRTWDVQPVEGTVVDGVTGEPVARAQIVSGQNPSLQAITDNSGTFFIEPQSRLTLSLRMFGSYVDHRLWQVNHEGYAPALAVTSTVAPARMAQPSNPTIPLFLDLPPAPESCPFGPYVVRLYQWKIDQPLLSRYEPTPQPHTVPCNDLRYRQLMDEAFVRLLEAADTDF